MPDHDDAAERYLSRFLTFIDAVVAIAITLLVLPLVELPAHVDDYASVGDLVQHNQAQIWAFLLSFVVVSRFWFVQHHALQRMVGYHDRIAALLMLWALTIVFLPFPTGLVAEAADSRVTKLLYVGTMLASTALVATVQVLLRRRPQLTGSAESVDPVVGIANAVVLLVALVVMLAVPATSYFPLLLLLLADPLAAGWRRLRG